MYGAMMWFNSGWKGLGFRVYVVDPSVWGKDVVSIGLEGLS